MLLINDIYFQGVRKTPHTAHKGGSREVSHVQSLLSRLACREEKMAQQLLSVGLALSTILEKARARTDKERWQEKRDK
jgi:hypothetical protein